MVKYQPGLIAKNLKLIKSKDWYNQRFDACLNLLWVIAELGIKAEPRKMKGGNCTSNFCLFEANNADWYFDLSDIRRITSLFLRRAKTGMHLSKKLIGRWRDDERDFYRLIVRLDKVSFNKLDEQGLRLVYNDLVETYELATSSSSLIDGFALGSDQIVQTEINKLLGRHKINKGRGRIFSILTAPVHQSFINEAELSLLIIALKIGSRRNLAAALKRPEIHRALARHQHKYFWLKNNYYDNHILTIDDFIQELKAILTDGQAIRRGLGRIKITPLKHKKEKRALLARLRPSRYLRNLLEISEDFAYWQDERKKRTFLFTHYASQLLEEIGRRYGYRLAEMKYLTRVEVLELLAGRKFPHKKLSQRAKNMIIYQKGNDYEILSGAAARRAATSILKRKNHSKIQDFRGLTASTGKARGLARIVTSVKEIDKIKTGDILVAVMTRPDYIIGIKKAAAIVTDEGGITCHAAIISRELGIPCIIGTKIGTKILKDGDLVEVNANHGWVRKVK